MSALKSSLQRSLGFMICVLLILMLAAPPSMVARADLPWTLYIIAPPASLTPPRKVCLHSKTLYPFDVSVYQGSLELPAIGASVSFHSDTGDQQTLTNSAGVATFSFTAKTEGQHTISGAATMSGLKSNTADLEVMVVKCGWNFTLHYREEYALLGNNEIVVYADVLYKESFSTDDSGNLVPVGGPQSAQYQLLATDLLKPLNIGFVKKDTSGIFSMDVKGQVSQNGVHLQLSSEPIPLDLMVHMGFTDVSHTRIIEPMAPVATFGAVDLLGKLGVHSIGFGEKGGVVERPGVQRIFFNLQRRLGSQLTIRLDQIKP